METITIESAAFKKIMKKLDFLEKTVRSVIPSGKWISEDEAMQITGLGKRSLRNRRVNGLFTFSTETGKNIKYLRSDIEDYLNNNQK